MIITADTTDTQIAVAAAQHYYPTGAPPQLCTRLVETCRYVTGLPDGGWPETRQGWLQAQDQFDQLSYNLAHQVADAAKQLERERDDARQRRDLSIAERAVTPYLSIVDTIVRLSTEAHELPTDDNYYVDVIRQTYPDLDPAIAESISRVCVARMNGPYRAYATLAGN